MLDKDIRTNDISALLRKICATLAGESFFSGNHFGDNIIFPCHLKQKPKKKKEKKAFHVLKQ